MTKKWSLLLLTVCGAATASKAQYYYKDLVSNQLAQAEIVQLKEQKIRSIKVHSFEGNKEPSEGFFCEKKISKDFRKIETYTRSYVSSKSLLTSYYNKQGQLIQSRDSSEVNVTVADYTYDQKGNIISIISNAYSSDDDFTTAHKEEHSFTYNEKNKPVQMAKIKNDKDTSLIDFLIDEKGNITDEIEPGRNGKHYYYYYDAKNRLTDIVKYNVVLKKLLPDFTFEYNSNNQVTQMLAVEDGVATYSKNALVYLTWKYLYNDGLKIIEKCFNQDGSLLGYFEYEYD